MSTAPNPTAIKLLETTLECFGADRTRWPVQVRRELSSLVADNQEAQKLVAEAAALDHLLDLAPRVALGAKSALAERIAAQAAQSAQSAQAGVSPFSKRGGFGRQTARNDNAYAGMALAASLMLGLLAGSQQALAPALQEVAASAGLESAALSGQIATPGDDGFGLATEDLL